MTQSSNNNPIGIFDSGVGGLSVWKEINTLMPHEKTVYIADSINAPYGEKPPAKIVELSLRHTEFLIHSGCKIIVVACNTATTNAISILREKYSIPFIGIEPATKPAAIKTQTGKIGILATKGTLASELFWNTSKAHRDRVEIIETVGTGLVPIVESGNFEDAIPLLQKYLTPMIEKGVDNIVLGCTHYPFLKPIIQSLIPNNIQITDSGGAVARRTHAVLDENSLLNLSGNQAKHKFYTNADQNILRDFLTLLNVHSGSIHPL